MSSLFSYAYAEKFRFRCERNGKNDDSDDGVSNAVVTE